ncbi:hypothetical protein EVAR_27931_1 [Eumeta japonica]|uniref:Uncharacterized protein n=1 Tax=Eumeta variegata TaxID=151549 RepID=A0A4C1UWB8_EUMVA|nr:hypothetical protein EVAR_27931_1 [Eumeta japonica]
MCRFPEYYIPDNLLGGPSPASNLLLHSPDLNSVMTIPSASYHGHLSLELVVQIYHNDRIELDKRRVFTFPIASNVIAAAG